MRAGSRVILAAAALAALALTAPAAPAQESPTLSEIEREVMCPVCGVPLELAREAPQAQQERRMIQELIDEGRTKDEIKDALVAEYGSEVLAVPDTSGFELTAWVVPGAAIILAGGAIVVGLRRWRRATAAAGDGSAEPSEEAIDPDDARRLEDDIGRYEL